MMLKNLCCRLHFPSLGRLFLLAVCKGLLDHFKIIGLVQKELGQIGMFAGHDLDLIVATRPNNRKVGSPDCVEPCAPPLRVQFLVS